MIASPAATAQVPSTSLWLEVGAGGLIFFDQQQRDLYGVIPVVQLGLSQAFGAGRHRAFLEVGYSEFEANELGDDPTFEWTTRTRIMPVNVGLRWDTSRSPTMPLRLLLAVAWQTVFSTWGGPQRDRMNATTFGLLLEIRPEYQIGSAWRLWLSQRFSLQGDTAYGGPLGELNYGGSTLELGLSRSLGRTPAPEVSR